MFTVSVALYFFCNYTHWTPKLCFASCSVSWWFNSTSERFYCLLQSSVYFCWHLSLFSIALACQVTVSECFFSYSEPLNISGYHFHTNTCLLYTSILYVLFYYVVLCLKVKNFKDVLCTLWCSLCIAYVCQGHWLDLERSADDWGWRQNHFSEDFVSWLHFFFFNGKKVYFDKFNSFRKKKNIILHLPYRIFWMLSMLLFTCIASVFNELYCLVGMYNQMLG